MATGEDLDAARRKRDAEFDAATEGERHAAESERQIAAAERLEAAQREAERVRAARTAETVAAEYDAALQRLEVATREALAAYRDAERLRVDGNAYRRADGLPDVPQPFARSHFGAALEVFVRHLEAMRTAKR